MAKKTKSKILHIGCGNQKVKNAIGVDINPDSDADVLYDLNLLPYPFPNNSFDTIVAEHILEHLENILGTMEELHRITKPGGRLYITAPHFASVDSFTDITHRHFFTSRSFDYLIEGKDLYKYRYSKIKYKLFNVWVGPKSTKNIFLQLLLQLINKHVIFYEKRFAFIFPVGVIHFELEVIK